MALDATAAVIFKFVLEIWFVRFEFIFVFIFFFSAVNGAVTATSCSARRLFPNAAAVRILAAFVKSFFIFVPLMSLLASNVFLSTREALPENIRISFSRKQISSRAQIEKF